jgi:hypothetical protein
LNGSITLPCGRCTLERIAAELCFLGSIDDAAALNALPHLASLATHKQSKKTDERSDEKSEWKKCECNKKTYA